MRANTPPSARHGRSGIRRAFRLPRRVMAGFAAGVAVAALALGGGSAWAFWTAGAEASASMKTAPVTLTITPSALDGVFVNTTSTLTRTGSFTVTNTSSTPGAVGATISGTGPLAAGLPVRIWPNTVAACTAGTPASATSGTWASAVAPSVQGVLPGSSVTYCARTDVPVASRDAISAASGSQSTNPVVTGTLTTAGWPAKGAAVQTTQRTQAIYPLPAANWLPDGVSRWYTVRAAANTNVCLDVSGSGTAGGTPILSYGCYVTSNQAFEILPVAAGDDRLVALRPANAVGTRLAIDPANGQQIIAVNGAGDTRAQQWYLQTMPGDRWQLVSALNGYCLVLPTSSSVSSTSAAPCTSANVSVELRREPVSFSASGTTVNISWGIGAGNSTLRLQTRNAGTTGDAGWTTRSTLRGLDARTFSFAIPRIPSGEKEARIVDANDNVVYGGMTFTVPLTGALTAGAGFG
ncbi:RICIN domain-containing protein [Leucobacter luti]|uniref:RICIN domain-containing protein n=1 Tax=Leucobacter luti TaxID=340320 RepID=UPI003D025379